MPFTEAFYVHNKLPYCLNDYYIASNTLCSSCKQGITGQCIEAQEGRFHPECFKCDNCAKPMDLIYYNLEGKLYCSNDIHAAEKRSKKKGVKRQTVIGNI